MEVLSDLVCILMEICLMYPVYSKAEESLKAERGDTHGQITEQWMRNRRMDDPRFGFYHEADFENDPEPEPVILSKVPKKQEKPGQRRISRALDEYEILKSTQKSIYQKPTILGHSPKTLFRKYLKKF